MGINLKVFFLKLTFRIAIKEWNISNSVRCSSFLAPQPNVERNLNKWLDKVIGAFLELTNEQKQKRQDHQCDPISNWYLSLKNTLKIVRI